jgi:GTP-binding protein
MFIDQATIKVKAGDGGKGIVSFHTEKYISRGGPDGGDGGHGGSVLVVGDINVDGLAAYRYQKLVTAEDGEPGDKRRQHGHSGQDTTIKVPLGTQLWHEDTLLADIVEPDQPIIIARGGRGGYGNAHFTSSTRRAPRVAELGEPGDERELRLELKLIADVGLVGLPTAGKSTFLSVVSNARPKIADYPFTTLAPNLGVADVDNHSLVIADIPGLIEGAAEGKGLGHAFLRHVERTALLLHLIDATEGDVVAAYDTVRGEVESFSKELAKRPHIIALTKIDAVEPKLLAAKSKKLAAHTSQAIWEISSVKKQQTLELLRAIAKEVVKARAKRKKIQAAQPTIPVLSLASDEAKWQVKKNKTGFTVSGRKIERFALRTDMTDIAGERRLRDIMRKMGIMHELRRKGAQPGDPIRIGQHTISY